MKWILITLILFATPAVAEELVPVPIVDGPFPLTATVDTPPGHMVPSCGIIVPEGIQWEEDCDLTQLQMRDFAVKRKSDLEALGQLLDAYERTRPAGAEGEWEALADAIRRIR